MEDKLQLLALTDALLTNWPTIRMLMGGDIATVDNLLIEKAKELSIAKSLDEVEAIIRDLLTLTLDTPAHEYVRSLIARADLRDMALATSYSQPETDDESRVKSAAELSSYPPQGGVGPGPDLTWVEHSAAAAGRDLSLAITTSTTVESVPVFFATNRMQMSTSRKAEKITYSAEPSEISMGVAYVTIPIAIHETGRVESPHWWSRHKQDKERYVLLGQIDTLGRDEFSAKLSQAITDEKGGDVLVFLHGFNVTFEEAARGAAQLSYDLQFHGAIILFSWPSFGSMFRYAADEDRAAASGEQLNTFLNMLHGGPWKNVHLLAHSMGNRVLVSGLADNPRPTATLGHVIMVAADVYVEGFRNKFPKMAGAGALKTSYVSRADRALLLSMALHRGRRIGMPGREPFVIGGLETVDATTVDTGLLRHSYFSTERSVLTDIGYLIREGFPASRRGLRQRLGKNYWEFPK